MKKDYVPRRNGDLIIWLNNFKNGATANGVLLGLTPLEVTALGTACTDITTSLNALETAKQAAQQQAQNTRIVKTTNLLSIRSKAQRMKTSTTYTTALGEALGIIGDEHVIDIPNSKPVLKLTKIPSGVQIDFNLLGFFDSVHIYKKRPADAAFSFLANDTATPYIDTAPAESGTRYYAYFIDHDVEVGLRSDEAVFS